MDAQQIKSFIDAMTASDLDEMEVRHDGWTLRLVRRGGRVVAPAVMPAPAVAAPAIATPVAGTVAEAPAPAVARPQDVLAPLFGTVHLTQAPGEPPFVTPGQRIEAGQLLCTIEAMKVFNEVRAEHGGTLVELLVTAGQEVEAGQALMRIV